MSIYWREASTKPSIQSKYNNRLDRHKFEKHIMAMEFDILCSIGFDMNLSPILVASGRIEGTLQSTCEIMKLPETHYLAAKKILKEDSFVFNPDFCLEYDDIYISYVHN